MKVTMEFGNFVHSLIFKICFEYINKSCLKKMDIEHKSIIHGYEGHKTVNNPSSNFTNDQVLGNDKHLW